MYHTAVRTLQDIILQEVGMLFFSVALSYQQTEYLKRVSDSFIYYLRTPSIFETISYTITGERT